MGWSLTAPLDEATLARAAAELTTQDPRLAKLHAVNGVPPLWPRPEGFATLVKIILEQQVSLDSAAAAYANLESALGKVAPTGFLRLDDLQLRKIGFSRQKAGYVRRIAEALHTGSLDLANLSAYDDHEASVYLRAIRGVGPWTSDVYLLFALRRPDVWPNGDRALVVSMAESFGLDTVPEYEAAQEIAAQWSPWRSVAARLLWHAYLVRRGRSLT